jgi:molybdopterin synthase catalytic subunit
LGVQLRVLFFGQLKDIAGLGETMLELPDGATVEHAFRYFTARFPRMGDMGSSIVVARNQRFVSTATPLSDGDELAFLPPVSGGTGPWTHSFADERGHFFGLTRQTIDVESLERLLLAGTDGAVVAFKGVVRNNTKGRPTLFLDYEGYEDMALRTLADLGNELVAEFAIGRVALVHRLGRMEIGETSVAVVVTAPHRRPAFDAALEGINRLKKRVPIWKKEHFADGEVWVEGEWDTSVQQR